MTTIDDAPAETPTRSERTLKMVITICALLFFAAVILWTVLGGKPDNSLHSSALAWSFGGFIATLGGLGIGALTPTVLEFIRHK